MANSLTTNPWILDTVAATVVFAGDVKVRHFEWVDYAADTDTVQVQDRFGKVIWKANGATDLEEVRSAQVGWVHGLALTQANAGVVRVYIE